MTKPENQTQGADNAGSQVQSGMLFMLAGMLLIPGIDSVAKSLQPELSSGLISWARFLFQFLLLLPMVIWAGCWRWPKRPVMEFARGFLISLATLLFFSSLIALPVADAIAIFFVEPLILTLLSPFFLGETIGWRRILAVVVGLIGALIIIQPGYSVFGIYAVLPMCAAVVFAFYLILTRKLAMDNDPLSMQFNAGFGGLVTMSAALAIGSSFDVSFLAVALPNTTEWLLLGLLGLIATTGHLLVVHGLKRAPASVLAPFQYFEIISATILGYIVFGDFPTATTWLGVSIIIASGLYVFHRERKVHAALSD